MMIESLSQKKLTEALNCILTKTRAITNADVVEVFGKCRKVNVQAIWEINKYWGGLQAYAISNNNHRFIKGREGLPSEHVIGIIVSDRLAAWFNGRFDQITFSAEQKIIIRVLDNPERLSDDIALHLHEEWDVTRLVLDYH